MAMQLTCAGTVRVLVIICNLFVGRLFLCLVSTERPFAKEEEAHFCPYLSAANSVRCRQARRPSPASPSESPPSSTAAFHPRHVIGPVDA